MAGLALYFAVARRRLAATAGHRRRLPGAGVPARACGPAWLICLAGTIGLAVAHLLWPVVATMCQLALMHLVSVRGRRTTIIAAVVTFRRASG